VNVNVGGLVRQERLRQQLSLRELARRVGVSPSLVSQIELDRVNPSVSTLYAIATELGISLDELLFRDARPGFAAAGGREIELLGDPVQRAGDRKVIRLASGVVWERLTTASIPNVDFLYVTYEVGGASSPEDQFQRHSGQEWGFVISGRLGVRIGFDEHILGPGDAIAFGHDARNAYQAQDEPVRLLCVVAYES